MVFGHSVQKARKEYNCTLCGDWIFAGEVYERHLVKLAPRNVFVHYQHYERPCPEDPHEHRHADEEFDDTEVLEPLPLAA